MRAREPDRSAILPVLVEDRPCRCGGWVVILTPEGMPVRTLAAADADEAAYVLEYELDVLMSETGRAVVTERAPAGERESCPHERPVEATRRQPAGARHRRLFDRYKPAAQQQ